MTSQSDISDGQLIQRFVQGDLDAFESLYKRHVKAVYNRVRYVVADTDVEDVTQEVFFAALKSVHTFRGEAQFSTWLRTLTNHKVAEYYRKRSRKKETMQVDLGHAESLGDQTRASDLEDRITLRRALTRLPDKYREIILLRFAEGMQFSEIASVLNKNPEATKSLFRRAMSALRETLDVKDD
jgi:RNA polymerase sigma-70 factor (ECF subfamily)